MSQIGHVHRLRALEQRALRYHTRLQIRGEQWLFPFLHPQDLLLVTASLFSAAGGSEAGSHRGVRRVALVVAALTVRIAASLRDLCVPCSAYSCTGTEAIVRIMCTASYTKERIAPGSGLLATMVELGEL